MPLNVVLSPQAVSDLAAIRAWYRQPGSGRMAATRLQAIASGIEALATFPFIGKQGLTTETREHIVQLHRIVYLADRSTVTVLAIFGPGQGGYEPR